MGQRLSKKIFTVIFSLVLVACSRQAPEPTQPPPQPTFIGSEQCSSCHLTEAKQWQGSHHELAMQVANSNTVLGDFSGQTLVYFDTETIVFSAQLQLKLIAISQLRTPRIDDASGQKDRADSCLRILIQVFPNSCTSLQKDVLVNRIRKIRQAHGGLFS